MSELLRRRSVLEMLAIGAAASSVTAVAAPSLRPEESEPQQLFARTPDGLNIAVQTSGPAGSPEILFIHGLAQCHLAWSGQVGPLGDSFRVVTYDNRGHGQSDKPLASRYYTEGSRWAAEVRSVIESAGLRRPVVVAWSLGGIILSHYLARQGSSHLAGIVFVGAVTASAPEHFEPETAVVLDGLGSSELSRRIPATRRFLDDCFACPLPAARREDMLVYNSMVPSPILAAIRQLRLPHRDVLKEAGLPVLAIHGGRDRLVRRSMSEQTVQRAQLGRLVVYPLAGHGPMLDEPSRFAADVASFRRSLPT